MVQVLPAVASFGEKLGAALENAGVNIAEGYKQRQKQQSEINAIKNFEAIKNNPNASSLDIATAFGNTPEPYKKGTAAALQPVLQERSKYEYDELRRKNIYNENNQDESGEVAQPTSISPIQNLMKEVPLSQNSQPQTQTAYVPKKPFKQGDVTTYSESLLKSLAGLDTPEGRAAKEQLIDIREEKKAQEARNKEERAEIREENKKLKDLGYKDVESYIKDVNDDRINIDDEELSLKLMENAVKSGSVDPDSYSHYIELGKAFGIPESFLSPLEDPKSKSFKFGLKNFIGQVIKKAFKGTTNQREIDLAESSLAKIGNHKLSNMAVIKSIQAGLDIRKQRIAIFDQLNKEGYPREQIPAEAQRRLNDYKREELRQLTEYINYLGKRSAGK